MYGHIGKKIRDRGIEAEDVLGAVDSGLDAASPLYRLLSNPDALRKIGAATPTVSGFMKLYQNAPELYETLQNYGNSLSTGPLQEGLEGGGYGLSTLSPLARLLHSGYNYLTDESDTK